MPLPQQRGMVLTIWLVVFATLLSGAAGAQPVPTTTGETRVAPITTTRFTDRDVVDGVHVDMRWRFGVLMGEPLQEFSGVYTLPPPARRAVRLIDTQVCRRAAGEAQLRPVGTTAVIRSSGLGAGAAGVAAEAFENSGPQAHSLFRAYIALPPGFRLRYSVPVGQRVYIDFRPDTLLPAGSAAAHLSVPSSPSWREAFQVTSSMGEAYFLAEAGAKALYREGVVVESIEAIDPRFATIDLRLAHERRVRETCGSAPAAVVAEAPASAAASAVEDPAAARLAAALGRVHAAGEARRETEWAAAVDAERAAIDQRHAEAQRACEAGEPVSPSRGFQPFYLCEDNAWNSRCMQGRRETEARLDREYREAVARYAQDLSHWQEVEQPACLARAQAQHQTELTQLEARERDRARIASGQLRGNGRGVER